MVPAIGVGMRNGMARTGWRETRPPSRAGSALTEAADGSIGVLVREHAKECDQDDLQIKGERPVLDVIEVVDQPFFDRSLTSKVVHLGPTCQAGSHSVAIGVAIEPALEIFDKHGALGTWSDQ